ncbi:MAG: NADH:ubiquinone oxidoreductase [Pseudooceanicola nanhaiensis]
MSASDTSKTCQLICWALAALAGIGVAVGASNGIAVLLAVILGGVVAIGGAMFLQSVICGIGATHWGIFEGLKGVPGWDDPEDREKEPSPVSRTPATPAPAPAPTPAPAPEPEPSKAEPAQVETPEPVEKADAKTQGTKDATDETQPLTLDKPRDGGADDLKKVSGVGPKLESMLNELGIYHYEQIAAWTPENIAWVDNRLTFKGRIERDDWTGQAARLASEKA